MQALKIASLAVLMTANVAQADVLSNRPTSEYLLGTVATGHMPKGMASTMDGRYLYVADMAGRRPTPNAPRLEGSVTIIDITTRALHRILQTPTGPRPTTLGNIEVEMTEDGRYALVTRMEGCGTGGDACGPNQQPSQELPTPMVMAIDTRTEQIVKMIPTTRPGLGGGHGPKVIKIRPQQSPSLGYVANYFSGDITIMNLENLGTGPLIDREGTRIQGLVRLRTSATRTTSAGRVLPKRIEPRGIAFTGDGRFAIVMGAGSNSLFVVDAIRHRQIAELPAPGDYNFRHVVINRAGTLAYISHMHGNAVSRISITRLVAAAQARTEGQSMTLPASVWQQILVPFPTAPNGFLVMERYSADHPNFPNGTWFRSEPNTIVLDPVNERYLYVSFRTTGRNYDGIHSTPEYLTPMTQMGKVDILDVRTGEVVKSLVSGVEPTALAVTPDNGVLMSSGFRNNRIYFYNLRQIISDYEARSSR